VIYVNVTFVPDQVVPPNLQGMHHNSKFKVMGQVALLMVLQLLGYISYDSPILHENIAKSLSGCITIDHEVLLNVRQC
jgi:predicted nucleic acid-binding protein